MEAHFLLTPRPLATPLIDFVHLLITKFSAFFRRFSKIFRVLSEGCTSVSNHLQNILRRSEDVSIVDQQLSARLTFNKGNHKKSISSLFTVKIKFIPSHVSRYDFSPVEEILVFRRIQVYLIKPFFY